MPLRRSKNDRDPARVPHPDPSVEAQLRQVLSRYDAVRRAEQRLAVIGVEQEKVSSRLRREAGGATVTRHLADQSARLRAERTELEEFISRMHEEAAGILAALGNDALYLGVIS